MLNLRRYVVADVEVFNVFVSPVLLLPLLLIYKIKEEAERRLRDELASARREAEERLSEANAQWRGVEARLKVRLDAAIANTENTAAPVSVDMTRDRASADPETVLRLKQAVAAAESALAIVQRDAAAAVLAERACASELLEKAVADAESAASTKYAASLRALKEQNSKVGTWRYDTRILKNTALLSITLQALLEADARAATALRAALAEAAEAHKLEIEKERATAKGDGVSVAALEKASRDLADALAFQTELRQQLQDVAVERDEAIEVMMQIEGLYKQQRLVPRTEDQIEMMRLRQTIHERDIELRALKSSAPS